MEEKLKELCEKITKEQQANLIILKLNCSANMDNVITSYKKGQKYTKVDIGKSGRYMIDNATGEIYGIKAYGVINKRKRFGNLDTIDEYYWGDYWAIKK